MFSGKQVNAIKFELPNKMALKTYFDKKSDLVIGSEISMDMGGEKMSMVAEMINIVPNAKLSAADMRYRLPRTAKKFVQPDYNAKLLPVGKLAEKFDLVSLKGDHITLDSAAQNKKAVLVNFWFYG